MTAPTKPNDGGPALPPNAGWRDNYENCRGLSKREAYALGAMQGMLAHPSLDMKRAGVDTAIAASAFQMADAMIAASEADNG